MTNRLPEGLIHVLVRRHLTSSHWRLLAGQYPSGSDDDLPRLNIVDPQFARDISPDHRRHSVNKLVPDLVALRAPYVLVIEMKPEYSLQDVAKLAELLGPRRADYLTALGDLFGREGIRLDPRDLQHVPAVGYAIPPLARAGDYCRFVVSKTEVQFFGNAVLQSL